MSKKVLLVGGSGLIGKALDKKLTSAGYRVWTLTRNKNKTIASDHFYWNPKKKILDTSSLKVDIIINLAGAGIADKRWSKKRKKELLDSRVESTEFLFEQCTLHNVTVDQYIGASAVGYYGDRGNEILNENSVSQGSGFLSQICVQWETAHSKFKALTNHFSIARIGIVLAKKGGALPKMTMTNKFGVSSYIGQGNQYYSWIHIDDLTDLFLFILDKKEASSFNMVSPNACTNKNLAKAIKKNHKTPSLLLPAPEWIIKLMLGEMSTTLLDSTRVLPTNALEQGFTFKYPTIDEALSSLL